MFTEGDWETIWRDQPDRMHHWPAEELIRWSSQLSPGWRVLEVGCGNGANLWYLAWQGFTVTGCDISGEALNQAAQLLEVHRRPGTDRRVALHRASATQLPFADHSFDAVCDVQCLQHLAPGDLKRAYQEVARILAGTGRFFSMHLDPAASDVAALYPDVGSVSPFDADALTGAGLDDPTVDRVTRTTGALTASWHLISARTASNRAG